MKIIKEGNVNYQCGECECVFQITSEKDINRNDRQLDMHGFLCMLPITRRCETVKCPQCGHIIVLKWK